ncbi:GTP-binding protein TypA/BipA-like [Vitis vinifera]|uniref:GTP-binding protein TypA/BipA-like n=1 Tax=Vitis vinifera TaxID=29760 RepID=A0A438EGH3_VITVI|nr:GTP-binding protein TypA/BipA-like [Vitis vinifera]
MSFPDVTVAQLMLSFEVLLEMSGKEYCKATMYCKQKEPKQCSEVSMGHGTITAYALVSLEPRGTLFVTPGMEFMLDCQYHHGFSCHSYPVTADNLFLCIQTYDGMIVGEHSRDTDLDINPVRAKELTNIRAASKDENVKLTPPRLMTLEEAIGYVASDELIEVTPKAIRLRKKYLDANKRKMMRNKPKD